MSLKALLLVLMICLCWAFNFIAAAVGLAHFPPFLFTVIRFVIVLVVLVGFLRPPPRDQWPRLIIVCLSNGGIHFALNFWALGVSEDISSVAIALQVYVPIASILAVVFLGEHLGWRSWLAIAVAFVGVLLVGADPMVLQQLDALGLTLLSALFLGLGTTLMKGLKGIHVFSFLAWTAVISLPLLLVCSLTLEQDQWQLIQSAEWQHWSGVVYSGLAASIIGHGLFFYLVQRYPVTSVAPYLLLTPVLAIILGVVFWGDEPGWRVLMGGVLVLAGILVINLRAKSKAQ